MNHTQEKQFDNFRPYFFSEKGAEDVREFINEIKAETRQEIINYQHGFVRDDGFGNPERAPEWQVIEDLIKILK